MHGCEVEPGIIKLAVRDMFDKIAHDERREYLLRVSFLEIYNEVLRDLLEPTKVNLKIHENAKREIFVGELSEHIVFNAEQVEELLAKGDRNRHIAGTNMNERSSRSHTIFRIVVESRKKSESGSANTSAQEGDMDVDQEKRGSQRLSSGSLGEADEFTGAVMVSCLNLVDLAGSERVGLTGAEGQRLKEGGHINKSLLSLGTVIARLSEDGGGGDGGHIPYRDSKLTRILQPSLGGNARTLIICTITPAHDYVEEALSTLKFASRAKTIQNKPEVNEELRGDALLRRLKRASELEKEVAQMRDLEKKKIKIEADNEALMRQLWKSQRERERLQKELEKQQSRMFIEQPTESGKQPVDSALTPRRQTWFPGLQRSVDGGPISIDLTGSGSEDMEEDSTPEPLATETVQSSNPVDQVIIDRVNELETQNDALQQTQTELSKENREMEATIQRFMRENNLLLSTLGQLATADTIPPSPAKNELAAVQQQPPRELIQVRRKLRALITTLDASQRQCQKFRTQRPEAEFLELELQAVRETLIEKEEQMVDLMRESDEVFSRCQEAEGSVAELQRKYQELQDELQISRESGVDARRMVAQLRMEAEHMVCQHEMDLAKQLSDSTLSMEQNQERHQAELGTLMDKIASQAERIQSMTVDNRQQEEGHETAMAQLQTLADEKTADVERLERDLSETQVRIAAAEKERDSLADVQAEVAEKQSQIEQLAAARDQAQAQVSELSAAVSQLEGEVREQQSAAEQKAAEVADLNSALDALRSSLAENDASHAKETADQKRAIEELVSGHQSAIQILEEQIRVLTEKASLRDVEVATLTEKLQQVEADKAQLASELSLAGDKASVIPTLQAEAEALRAGLAELRDAQDQASETLTAKQSELDSVTEERTRFETRIEDLESQNADVWERVSELTLTNENLAGQVTDLESKITDRDSQLAAMAQDHDLARTQNEELVAKQADALADAEETGSKLQAALNAKTAEAGSLAQQLEALRGNGSELAEKLEKANMQVSEAEARLVETVQQLDCSASKVTALEAELVRANDTVAEESAKAKDLTDQLEDMSGETARLKIELEESRTSCNTATATVESLRLQVAEINEAMAQTTASLRSTELELESLQAEHAAVNEKLTETTSKLADEQSSWETMLSNKDAELRQLAEKHDSAMADHQRKIADWQARERSAQETTALLEKQLATVRDQLATLETDMAETDQSKSAIASLNTELSKKLEAAESSLQSAQTEIAALAAATDDVSSRLAAATKEHTEAVDQWDAERRQADNMLAGLEESLAGSKTALEESNNSLTVMAAELESQATASGDRIAQLENTVSGLETQSSDLRMQLASAEEQRDDAQESARQLQEELESAKVDLVSATSRFESQISASHDRIALLEGTKSELEIASVSLRKQLELVESQHDASQETERQLRGELESVNAELAAVAAEAKAERSAAMDNLEQKEALAEKLKLLASDSIEREKALEKSHESKVAELEYTIQQLSAERTKLGADVKDIQGRLESAVSVGQQLNDALSERKAELEKTKAEQAKSTKQRAQLATRLAALQSDLEATSQEKTGLVARVKQLQSDNESISIELSDAKGRETELLNTVDDLNARIAQTESEHSALVAGLDSAKSGYTDEIHDLRTALSEKAEQMQLLGKQVDQLRRLKEETEAKCSESEKLMHESESKLQASEDKIRELEADLGRQAKKQAIAEKEAAGRIGSLEAEVEGLCDQLLAKSTEADAALQKLADAQTETSGVSARYNQLKSDYRILEERAKDTQSVLEGAVADAKDQLAQKDAELKEAEAALQSANSKASLAQKDARSEIAVLEAKVQEMDQTIAGLNTTATELRAELESRPLEQVSNDNELVEAADKKRLAAEDSLRQATEMIKSLAGERDKAQQGIDMLKTMMTELAQ
ncbi:hypothetical protein FBU59_000562, partial [Linderina macrospora]